MKEKFDLPKIEKSERPKFVYSHNSSDPKPLPKIDFLPPPTNFEYKRDYTPQMFKNLFKWDLKGCLYTIAFIAVIFILEILFPGLIPESEKHKKSVREAQQRVHSASLEFYNSPGNYKNRTKMLEELTTFPSAVTIPDEKPGKSETESPSK
jgi:hypothetical protein